MDMSNSVADVSNSAAHKRIRMEMAKRNSTGMVTITREQAMQLRNEMDPELKDMDKTALTIGAPVNFAEQSPVRKLPSPPAAKRSSLPDLRKLKKDAKKGTVDVHSFAELPVFGVSKNNFQAVKRDTSSLTEENKPTGLQFDAAQGVIAAASAPKRPELPAAPKRPEMPVAPKVSAPVAPSVVSAAPKAPKAPAAPKLVVPQAPAAPKIAAPQAPAAPQVRKPMPELPPVAASSKRKSAPEVQPVKPVAAPVQVGAVDLSAKYSLGEVVLVTLSDGRPMCGEIMNIKKDTMLVEYSEDDVMYRALIKVTYDPDADQQSDDLVSIMETSF